MAAFVIPLGLDTFAIAIALGVRGLTPWKPALIFMCFETIMPVFGIFIGAFVGRRFETIATQLGALILIILGLHTMRESCQDETQQLSFTTLRGTMTAGFAISTDEAAIGFPLGTLHIPVTLVLAAIAVQAFIVTAGGILIGTRIRTAAGLRASTYAGVGAGIAFAAVGLWMLFGR